MDSCRNETRVDSCHHSITNFRGWGSPTADPTQLKKHFKCIECICFSAAFEKRATTYRLEADPWQSGSVALLWKIEWDSQKLSTSSSMSSPIACALLNAIPVFCNMLYTTSSGPQQQTDQLLNVATKDGSSLPENYWVCILKSVCNFLIQLLMARNTDL